jgi:xanthine dehydrogenase YagS FAD-binding subunit
MNSFEFASPSAVAEAVGLLSETWGETEILAGGTDLVTSLKQGVTSPKRVVSLAGIKDLKGITVDGKTLRIGATTPLRDLIASADVQKNFPALVTAAKNIGSPQIINVGTVGGDLCQRPRCWYFRWGYGLLGTYDGKPLVPGGDNRYHAIFPEGPAYFVNPSSFAPALIALRATALIQGPGDKPREIPVSELFKAPAADTDREFSLKPNEIVTQIAIPISGLKNATYEVRQRKGLDWPIVAAAVAFRDDGGKAADASVVLGHVAPTPRAAESAARAINGKAINDESARACGKVAAEGAKPLSMNEYKVQLVKVAVARALLQAVA